MESKVGRQVADYQRLYDAAACGLLVTEIDGLIREVNQTFCRWVGRDAAELIGLVKVQSLLTMGGRIFHQTHWTPLLQFQGSVSEVKFEVVHKDGNPIPMIWNALRREVDGVVWYELAVFLSEDRHKYEQELMLARQRAEEALAKEKEARQELSAAQSEIQRARALAEDRALFAEQMMGVVSHDLRNPLSVISMSASLMPRFGTLNDKQLRVMEQLSGSTARAIRLISDLLDFTQARIGNGLQVDAVELDLHAVVAACVAELRVIYPTLVLRHVAQGSGRSAASADRLAQLIGNLVSNAVSYGTHSLPITVTSSICQTDCAVSVHNYGTPIPEAIMATLFDAMTRGEGESATHSIGLGLYVVQQIARAFGGDVAVISNATVGTTFTATFPRNIELAEELSSPVATTAERARQQEVDRLEISALQDAAYDEIVRMAADTFDMPIALISILDGDRQWFKSRIGLQAAETPREYAFCAHAVKDKSNVMVVEDATIDSRFAGNPLVTGEPNIRFYAGAPLVTSSGHAIGTVCVIDTKPRTLDARQFGTLQLMAQEVVAMMESRVQGLLRRSAGDQETVGEV